MTHWTQKHQEFALKHSLTPSAVMLWQWLLETGNEGEREPDLKEFNSWIGRHRGKKYHRDTLKGAIALLEEAGIIVEVKFFTWNVRRIVLRSIDSFKKPRKKLLAHKEIRASECSNPESACEDVIAAAADSNLNDVHQKASELDKTELEKIDELQKIGVLLSKQLSKIVAKFSLKEIRLAIAHFIDRGGLIGEIFNPPGWISRCLRERWWEDYYSIKGNALLAELANP